MLKKIYFFVFAFLIKVACAYAADEPYVNMLKGGQLKADSFFIVTDEKIRNAATNTFALSSVDNVLSFEIDFYSNKYFYNTSFTCTANLTIDAFDRYDTTQHLSGWPKTIDLQVQYSKNDGERYKGIALYKFQGAHKFKVTVNSISSPELGSSLPEIFLLKGTTIVHDRKYTLQLPLSGARTTFTSQPDKKLNLQWNPGDYPGAEMFDLEYTFIDKHSLIGERLKTVFGTNGEAGPFSVPADTLAKWFKNNNTRVTLTTPSYLLNLSYDSGYVLFRLRGAQTTMPPDELRLTTAWNYQALNGSTEAQTDGIVFITGHEQNLNWQYSATFAEEGKRKEVMSYFDGSLKSRQAVTLNNSDNRSVVQESLYDDIGRPVVSLLPAPADDASLHYFRAFNRNLLGNPFSFSDIVYANCGATVSPLSTASGTSQYYSPQNPFAGFIHRDYIPNAFGYPFAVTEHTPDNTGRIKRQGGVGPDFQLNSGHETSYFYGKPTQIELDRLFGNEAGNASHYLKNMVVDPNGQVSVSYLNASGKTIATALAGKTPPNLHSLPSNNENTSVRVKNDLIAPENFSRNAANYSLTASATFLAPVTGDYTFNYDVNPQRLDVLHGAADEKVICNTCYYDLLITVKDGCDEVLQTKRLPAGFAFDTTCAAPAPINGTFSVGINKIGEYNVYYELKVSKAALDFYDVEHIKKNTNLKKINHFLLDQLKETDFTGCYSNCETCKEDLGEKTGFNDYFKTLYQRSAVPFGETDSLWVNNLYDSLYANCAALQNSGECANGPCDERLALLKSDVTPSGQYALVDSTWQYFTNADGENDSTSVFSFHNDGTNLLYNYTSINFTDETGKRDSVVNDAGNVVPVKQLTQNEFVKNWKDVWADSLVTRHPEYCYYLWCLANPGSYAFDDRLQDFDDADSAMRAGYFDSTRVKFDALLQYDPFFNGGLGSALKARMSDSLRLFSRTLLRYGVPDKNILQTIDVILYCKDQNNGWQSCQPPGTDCRSDYQEWLLYRNLYLNLKRRFYEEARRTSNDPRFANCINCFIGKDALPFKSITGSTVPFTDSTCNYACPGGVYTPATRKKVSYFVQYGSAGLPPTGTPAGYGACQFYNVFDLQTTAGSNCRFFNVWVCTYDSAGTGSAAYSSQCDNNPQAQLYKDKIRRYPDYVNTDDFIGQVLSTNPAGQSDVNAVAIVSECKSACEAQADNWIAALSGCNADQTKLAQLRAALVQVCNAGCAQSGGAHGASSVPAGSGINYNSFEDAIISILGAGALNDSCTAELINTPYPYDRQPVDANRIIYTADYDVCSKLQQYRKQYASSGYAGSLHSYLAQLLKTDYTLDSTALDMLIKGCTQCNGILKEPVTLPIAFEKDSRSCLDCSSVQQLLTAFNGKYNITSANPRYETLLTNYFNHSLGFSLTYQDYKDFLDSCAAHPGAYAGRLCNQPVSPQVADNGGDENSCTAELFTTALENAYIVYNRYIDSVHIAFREAYTTKCLNVQAHLAMTADLYEYHYTLYYYDQSGNLVKTVPPEGVKLLNETELANVALYRKLQNEGCYQYSDSVLFANNGRIEFPMTNTAVFEYSPFSVESYVNLTSHGDQVLYSKRALAGFLHRWYGFAVSVVNNKIQAQLFGSNASFGQATYTVTSLLNASTLLPAGRWTHLVIERTQDTAQPVKIYVGGRLVATAVSLTGVTSPQVLIAGAPVLNIGGTAGGGLPTAGLSGSLKNLRIYTRALSTSELVQNAFDACQLPASRDGLVFWAPLNDATNNNLKDIARANVGTLTGFTWQPFTGVYPAHGLPTWYAYNSLNQVVKQSSPDGGESNFWYDRLGRLTASQNAEQKTPTNTNDAANRYSYTLYDKLGRITTVGEKTGATNITTVDTKDSTALINWLATGTNKQVTKTLYDDPVNLALQTFNNSRKRVVASVYLEAEGDAEGDSTVYAYDLTGNVKTLLQHVKALVASDPTNGRKRMDYDYDLVSGKVNSVTYQKGRGDQFYYKYGYDAENRVVSAQTSRDALVWIEDATYRYYLHGPLARMELGHYKVQGLDYAYTLQGWLKGINGDVLNSATDMGKDGEPNTVFSKVSKDAYAFKLGYFGSDYGAISGTSNAAAFNGATYAAPGSFAATGNQLFNGNISYTTLALSKINGGATTGYSYGYDQLNRLREMRQHTVNGAWSNSTIISAYAESVSYDANGNILGYLRKGANTAGNPLAMDDLTYKYNRDANGRLLNNRLEHVEDAVVSSNYSVDIDNQTAGNYSYDKIGNLIKDNAENISGVNWTMYGKIRGITKTGTTASDIAYSYDAIGNRTMKSVNASSTLNKTFYVRDAQGNVIGIYTQKNSEGIKWDEQHLYGGKRLGMWQYNNVIPTTAPVVQSNGQPIIDDLLIGSRTYEGVNHLGNVLATISDKKIGHDGGNAMIDYYIADVVSAQDYYPFGMLQPGRTFGALGRYGFNGKENDNKTGEGNVDLGDRVLDVRMGRFFNCDPDEQKYPFQSTYTVATNNPVHIIDVDGRGPTSTHLDQAGKVIAVYNDGDLNVYKHQTAKNQEDVDKWRLKFNNKSGNGIKIGRTLIWNSFYDDATETYRGSISDVNKTSGWAFMISAWDDIKNTSSDDLLRRTYYAFNAHEYDKYDFKNKGKNKSTPENELLENRYRGSVLMYDGTTPIYASARDVGNYFAGVVASRTHEKKIEFLQIAGAFNYHNQNIKKVINSIAIDFKDVPIKFPTYGEDFRSDYFHRVGYHEIIGVDQLKKLGSKLWIE